MFHNRLHDDPSKCSHEKLTVEYFRDTKRIDEDELVIRGHRSMLKAYTCTAINMHHRVWKMYVSSRQLLEVSFFSFVFSILPLMNSYDLNKESVSKNGRCVGGEQSPARC